MRFLWILTITAAGLIAPAVGAFAQDVDGCSRPGTPCLPDLRDHGAVADVAIAPPAKVPGELEARVPPPSRDLAPIAPFHAGSRRDILPPFDPADVLFSSSLADKASLLGSCRVDVARARGLPPGDLPDETVHVRLSVSRDGRVADSTVSTTGAIGLEFLDCLKKQVRDWWLLPPQGGRGAYVDVNIEMPSIGRPHVRPASEPVS